jgi:uncharacterized membrane protein
MKKVEFFKEMERLLQDIPENERQDMLYDYEEHFQIALEKGKSEEEIVTDLGTPKTIAKELKANYHIHQAKTNTSATNITRAVIASVSLGFFNLVFVLGPLFGLLGILISLYAVVFTLIITPFALLVMLFTLNSSGH